MFLLLVFNCLLMISAVIVLFVFFTGASVNTFAAAAVDVGVFCSMTITGDHSK